MREFKLSSLHWWQRHQKLLTSSNSLCGKNFTELFIRLDFSIDMIHSDPCTRNLSFSRRKSVSCNNIFNLITAERERAMLFPDYYFLAERRLVNHAIEEKRVKNLDDCELLCYLSDSCVSLNFKKDPDNNQPGHICELNNATHLKYDSDLTTDANFYYRGSKVSYKSIFRNCRLRII